MLSFAEKGFMVVISAGLFAVVVILLVGNDQPEEPALIRPDEGAQVRSTTQPLVQAPPETSAAGAGIRTAPPSLVSDSLTLPELVRSQQGTVTTDNNQPVVTWVRQSKPTLPATTPVSVTVTEAVTPSTATTEIPSATTTAAEQLGDPPRCPLVQELWEADGYPVEDLCTLAEVKRIFTWAWTGTDRQRRSAIRNSHLLDEIFAALDEYGRTHDAGLFDPDTRGEWTPVFDDFRWRGGPRHDRAVIEVSYGFVHRDYPTSSRWTDTLVQVEGEWKLSYRRSYCRQANLIMEYVGSDLRCPPDPDPEVNEDEDPDIIREYES